MSRLVADASAVEKMIVDRSTVLRPAAASVVKKLPLTSEEGYLLSRVDRPMTVSDIIAGSGLTEDKALQLLLGLVQKGALLAPAPERSDGRWGDFVFSPAELHEDVDLDLERRKEVLFLFHTLDRTSHYRLLGVKVNADATQIRHAYLERSKVFHPDAYFRKRLGTYLPKIETIFQRLRQASEVLSDDEARQRYEREGAKVFTPEEKAAVVDLEIARLEDEKRARERRERLLRSKGLLRWTKARELLVEGDRLLGSGEVPQATLAYQLALELDPRLEDARERLTEARRVGQTRRADLAYEEAQKAEEAQQHRRALELLRGAAEFDPSNARVLFALGRLLYLVDGKSSAKEARMHVARSIELGEKTVAAYELHAELLTLLGEKKRAQRELEFAKALLRK